MSNVILETERLLLRELTREDFDALLAIWGDAETMLYYPQAYSREMLEAALQRQFNSYGLCAPLLSELDRTLGRWFTTSTKRLLRRTPATCCSAVSLTT